MTKRPHPGSAHDALARMFATIGRTGGSGETDGVYVAAAFLDLSHWALRKQLDPDQSGLLAYSRVAQLTQHFRVSEAAEHLALCAGGVFLPVPEGATRIGALSFDVMRETGEALARLAEGLATSSDGGTALTRREAAAALPEIGHAVAALAALYAEVMAAALPDGGR